ncbi:hypothetical protein B0H13DRAFT_2038916 [Mycena leptocephala]|nr:hypothetical protein B0H13DRAFT_2038916 [Mycena leptocephala]
MPPRSTLERRTAKFPVELERIIFELAAQAPSSIPALVRVAQRVHECPWYIYNVLNFDTCAASAVLESIKTKPAAFLMSAVRHVSVSLYEDIGDMTVGDLENLLRLCPGITDLCISGDITMTVLLPALAEMHIQRLSVDLGANAKRVDLEHPLFAAVTHLEILDSHEFENDTAEGMEWLLNLSALPVITHLSLSGTPPNPAILKNILKSCPHLRALIVAFPVGDEVGACAYVEVIETVKDARLVGARGSEDIWVKAEKFVDLKTHGERSLNAFLMYCT